MQNFLVTIEKQLIPVEELFFQWLLRTIAVAILVGSAWIDDAPPLELSALILTVYVLVRVLMQSSALFATAPFSNRILKFLFTVFSLSVLLLSFVTIVIFSEVLSEFAMG